jgi:2,3-dihydro-2,3-dihydroxybenzoate dehydrogenase
MVRSALVAGGGRGIGLACAHALADAGYSVAIADRDLSGLKRERFASGSLVTTHEVDIADPAQVDGLFDSVMKDHRRLDVAVNAAGKLLVRPALETDADAWDDVFAVNSRGSFLIATRAARVFREADTAGRIILVGSIIARVARLNNVAYCASKAAVIQMARCMALEMAPYRITVNVVSPGSTRTEMLVEQLGNDAGKWDAAVHGDLGSWRLGVPVGRLAEPDDHARLVLFLAGESSSHITGQEFIVDGGQSIVGA